MADIVKGTFIVKCAKCDHSQQFTPNLVNFEAEESSEESMGPKTRYSWSEDIECQCGNEIKIEYDVWEYPILAFNDDDINITGGVAQNKFEYDFGS